MRLRKLYTKKLEDIFPKLVSSFLQFFLFLARNAYISLYSSHKPNLDVRIVLQRNLQLRRTMNNDELDKMFTTESDVARFLYRYSIVHIKKCRLRIISTFPKALLFGLNWNWFLDFSLNCYRLYIALFNVACHDSWTTNTFQEKLRISFSSVQYYNYIT